MTNAELLVKMAIVTKARADNDRMLRGLWEDLHALIDPCLIPAKDGNPCVVTHQLEYDKDYHVSREEISKNHYDKIPGSLSVGLPSDGFTHWLGTKLVPINVKTDTPHGSWVAAWVREEDVWRFIKE